MSPLTGDSNIYEKNKHKIKHFNGRPAAVNVMCNFFKFLLKKSIYIK